MKYKRPNHISHGCNLPRNGKLFFRYPCPERSCNFSFRVTKDFVYFTWKEPLKHFELKETIGHGNGRMH